MSGVTGACVPAAGIPGFVLGAILTFIILICVPDLYRNLRSCLLGIHKYTRSYETKADERHETIADDRTSINNETRRSNNYTEIDERKTHTFPPKQQASSAKSRVNKGQGYEDYAVDTKIHRYSDLEANSFPDKGGNNTQAPTTESYEPVSLGPQKTNQEKRLSNHEYFILEPGSDKRLPVKMLENKVDTLSRDPGHLYFILEPGTNKVTPLSQSSSAKCSKYSSGRSDMRDSGHIYFVLEPMAETDDSENLAYAVNDVATSPSYFILEKTELKRAV